MGYSTAMGRIGAQKQVDTSTAMGYVQQQVEFSTEWESYEEASDYAL